MHNPPINPDDLVVAMMPEGPRTGYFRAYAEGKAAFCHVSLDSPITLVPVAVVLPVPVRYSPGAEQKLDVIHRWSTLFHADKPEYLAQLCLVAFGTMTMNDLVAW